MVATTKKRRCGNVRVAINDGRTMTCMSFEMGDGEWVCSSVCANPDLHIPRLRYTNTRVKQTKRII